MGVLLGGIEQTRRASVPSPAEIASTTCWAARGNPSTAQGFGPWPTIAPLHHTQALIKHHMPEQQVQELLSDVDRDGNGRIDYEEVSSP
jgi:hypothetical protein